MSRKLKIVKPVAVAVEGANFFHFLLNQIADQAELQEIQLWDFKEEGLLLEQWLQSFRAIPRFDTLQALGIICDAEDSAQAMQRSVTTSFHKLGFAVPSAPNEIAVGSPHTAYLIIPHMHEQGCLEHAILEAVKPNVPLSCAEDFLACVDQYDRNDNWPAKVKVHTVIAGSAVPEQTLGASCKSGSLWDWEQPSLPIMLDFMKALTTTFTSKG